jgi:RecB family exonuclease
LETITISGKIDCLYQTRDGRWKIVDYKTGRLPAADASAILEKYDVQLAIYALAVKSAIGRMPDAVEIVLVGDEVTSVSLDLTDEFLAATSRKIHDAIEFLRSGTGGGVADVLAAAR